MDPALKHWLGLWDYLDHNFWGFWPTADKLTGRASLGQWCNLGD